MKIKKNKAYTLIEIVITMVIMISIALMAVLTLSAYAPKNRLLDSLQSVEQTLNRAQMEATARSTWSCVSYAAPTLTVRMDTNGNRTCGDAGDLQITTLPIRENVTFTSCGGLAFDFTNFGGVVWFDSAGAPRSCVAGICGSATSFQLVLTSSELPSGNRAREVEAVSSGLIAIVNRNEKGYLTTVFSKSIDLPTGCE